MSNENVQDLLREAERNLESLASGLADACMATSMCGPRTQEVITLCDERLLFFGRGKEKLLESLDSVNGLRQALLDDLEGEYPDGWEDVYLNTETIKRAFLHGFEREIRIVEELIPSLPHQEESPRDNKQEKAREDN